ncbi:gliding motility lipoprotein GldB [Joostella sp. CR20]|uniref:gliding motility lipoprotein GldB n=1 Tax=Joostella sp. CR20 TaxID=2804312 RepID=UPI00313B24EB
MNKFLCLLTTVVFVACSNQSKLEEEIAQIAVTVDVSRFEVAFSEATPKDLPKLKSTYPYLFPAEFSDDVWFSRMNDSLQKDIFKEIQLQFRDFQKEESEIKSVFQHVKYYYPNFESPKVVTVISDVDYKNRVIYADSLLLIGLDNYLGASHKYYGGIQQYIKKNFEAEQIPVDVARTLAKSKVPSVQSRTFLAQLVYFGKLYYLMDLFYPSAEKNKIMGYTQNEYNWALANENYIWRYFIERELLFSTEAKLNERFINPAPFSKFYLELDNESPGRLGQFIGWQIVSSYMQNNEVSLQQMLNTSAEELFNKSKYKPEK